MRGKRNNAPNAATRCGITPADAGKTEYYAFPDEETGDHPRGCGENDSVASEKRHAMGSPPRMRGKHHVNAPPSSDNRITPADAGKTALYSRKTNALMDHPRGCGENRQARFLVSPRTGSPPRMRGKLRHFKPCDIVQGITPADAGKTPLFASISEPFWGSPPRMRGKPRRRLRNWHFVRITPADAGKTRTEGSYRCRAGDHPRGCGENCPHPTSQRARLGSPPRMRGKPQVVLNVKCFFGITPADAGKTFDSLT